MMRFAWLMPIGLLASTAASAVDKDPCPPGLICASNPVGVADAVRAAGYKGLLSKDDDGDPMVETAMSGYSTYIYFYGCEKAQNCDSLQLQTAFSLNGKDGAAIAKGWNGDQRFSAIYVSKKGNIILNMDVTTVGGINQKNFADVISWMENRIARVQEAIDKAPAPKA